MRPVPSLTHHRKDISQKSGKMEKKWAKMMSCATLVPYPMPMRLELLGWLGHDTPGFPNAPHHSLACTLHLPMICQPHSSSLPYAANLAIQSPKLCVELLCELCVLIISHRVKASLFDQVGVCVCVCVCLNNGVRCSVVLELGGCCGSC